MVDDVNNSEHYHQNKAKLKWKGVSDIVIGNNNDDYKLLCTSVNQARYNFKFMKHANEIEKKASKRRTKRRQSHMNVNRYKPLSSKVVPKMMGILDEQSETETVKINVIAPTKEVTKPLVNITKPKVTNNYKSSYSSKLVVPRRKIRTSTNSVTKLSNSSKSTSTSKSKFINRRATKSYHTSRDYSGIARMMNIRNRIIDQINRMVLKKNRERQKIANKLSLPLDDTNNSRSNSVSSASDIE